MKCTNGGRTLRLARLPVLSLRTKLLLFSLSLVLVPGAVFGLIAISNDRHALTEAVGSRLAEEARSGADSLSGKLRDQFSELRTFARQDVMREIRIGDLDKRISALLVSLQREEGSMIDLRVSDFDGRIIAASDPSRIGEVAHPGSKEANNAPPGESLRGPLPVAPSSKGREAMELVVPVPDPDHRDSPVGTLTAVSDWKFLTNPLARIRESLLQMGLDVDVLVADESGVVIGGAAREGSATPFGTDLRSAGWTSAAATRDGSPFGFVVERHPGMLVGYRRLAPGDPPWTVLVVQPLSEALRPVGAMTIRLGAALAAVLAAALGLGLLLANRIAGPLRELTRAIQTIARGERAVPVVSPRSRDEVGELAAAFNQMLVDLRRAQSEVLETAKFAFVGELAAGVAHEVRTALGVLRSSTQILQPSLATDGEAAELTQIMLEEIEHLDGVVAQLLNLGRPRELTIAPTRMSEVVLRAADFVEPQARGKGVMLERVAAGDGALALCDEEQVYQVALNLLVNAIQVVPAGGAVTVALLAPEKRMVGFEVRDNGPGIPEELREKIFVPFFTNRDGGVGLGLTLVRRVIQEHHGRLSLESEVGRGSVFRVELPEAESSE